jgi:hypothetical protein
MCDDPSTPPLKAYIVPNLRMRPNPNRKESTTMVRDFAASGCLEINGHSAFAWPSDDLLIRFADEDGRCVWNVVATAEGINSDIRSLP